MGTATELPERPPAPAAESEAIISEGQSARPAASVPDEQALDAIRDTSDPDADFGIVDDVLLILAIAFFGGGVLYLLWSHRHADRTIAD